MAPTGAEAQSFSCSFGRGACLDYGDTVCSSSGKCVDESAVCFDQYTCSFERFVCASDMSDLEDEYERLISRHNSLVDEYNVLLSNHEELVDRQTSLQEDYEDLLDVAEDQEDQLIDIGACLDSARTLTSARACAFRAPPSILHQGGARMGTQRLPPCLCDPRHRSMMALETAATARQVGMNEDSLRIVSDP